MSEGRPSVNRLVAAGLLAVLAMTSCRIAGPPGEVEHVAPYLRAPEPVWAVEVFLEPIAWEQRPYETIAHISTEVRARNFPTMAEAEAEAYARLRFFAARSGALAVINVQQWVMLDGAVVEIEAYDPRPAEAAYIIHMRAEAVRFQDQRD